jgi:DNA-binding NtrC family response regulator
LWFQMGLGGKMTNNKILIVDDEACIRNMLKIALNRIGYKVRVATGAEEAFEILEQEQIPVIFIDLALETMNGFELCERVRKDHPDAIIYALSGHAGLFDPQDFREAGFDGYDAKPIVIENLYKIVKDSFERIDRLAKNLPVIVIKRILIIDDDDHIRKMLRTMLEHEDYTVSEASSGEEGCIRYSEQPADLIITDLVMPGKSGIETALDIKEENPEAKFILMSGYDWYGIDAEFAMAEALGAFTIKKPFDRKSILKAIKQIQNLILFGICFLSIS